jgi:hypothetical protein
VPPAAPLPEPVAAPLPEPVPETRRDASDRSDRSDGPDESRRHRRHEQAAASDNPYGPEDPAPTPAPAAEPAPKPEPEPAATTGKLSISIGPDVAGPVAVSVDGAPKGNAPLSVELPAGLHEVAFTIGDKRTLRMVSIKAGETKGVVAKGTP